MLLFLSLLLAGVVHQSMKAQDRRPITLSESDVSPAARAVNSLIQKGATQDRTGDYGSAIETFELALQRLRSIPEMKRDEDGLLVRLGRSYVGARRLDDAVRTFRLLLDTRTENCRKNIAAVEYCADAQYYIGFADMQKGDFEAAIPFLTQSIGSYAHAANSSEFVEYKMIKEKQQAEAEIMLAGALLRTGRKERAIDVLNRAIVQLTTVEQRSDIQVGIRESARTSLKDARAALEQTRKY